MSSFQRNVDFVVGSQFGDEAKGQISKLLADQAEMSGEPYTWTARVGASNAEHRINHGACELCARILPSAAAFRDDIKAVLGAGHCFRPDHLTKEATHLGIPLERIYVDPMAMWLKEDHARANRDRGDKRGTTGWGIGAAIAEKVARHPDTQLIRDNELLQKLLGNRLCRIASQPWIEESGLFESSQGAMLSLDHGHYPYSTAYNVTAPAMCGHLGISTHRVRRVVGCVRLVFMRVSGPSGPTGGQELSYDQVEERTDLRVPNHKRLQGDSMLWTSTSGKSAGVTDEERLFELSLEELHYSHKLNGYTELAVTFADFHRKGNYRVREWSSLHPDTQTAIRTIEKELQVPVTIIRTGQGEHDTIWLGDRYFQPIINTHRETLFAKSTHNGHDSDADVSSMDAAVRLVGASL